MCVVNNLFFVIIKVKIVQLNHENHCKNAMKNSLHFIFIPSFGNNKILHISDIKIKNYQLYEKYIIYII